MLADPKSQLYYPLQNTLIDGSGHGRNGTLGGSPACTFVAGGPRGRALYFPGTGYVATPSFGLSGTVVWFAARLRSKFNTTIRQCFIGDDAISNTIGFLLCERYSNSNSLLWWYATGAGTNYAVATDCLAAPYNNTWTHMCIACDYANKKTYFARNGAPFGSPISMTGTPVFPSNNRVHNIGSYNSTPGSPITDGDMANVYLATLATAPTDAARNWNAKRLAMGLHPIW